MYYNQTPHALNLKEQEAIIYVDAFGETIKITAENLGREEFAEWKEWSDHDFHVEAMRDHVYKNHNVSLEQIASRFSVPDRETLMIEAEERRERAELRKQVGIAFFTCLTDIQQDRMWMYAIDGLNTCQIAEKEGAAQQSVYESLERARKNILIFLQKGPCKTAIFPAYSEGVIN